MIQYGNWGFNSNEDTEIKDLLDTGVKNIVEKIRSGLHKSLYLAPDKDGEIDGGFLQLECGGSEFIFLQTGESGVVCTYLQAISWHGLAKGNKLITQDLEEVK